MPFRSPKAANKQNSEKNEVVISYFSRILQFGISPNTLERVTDRHHLMKYGHLNGCLFIILIFIKLTIKSHTNVLIF